MNCPVCNERKKRAKRTYWLHSLIMRIPKGEDNGGLINFSLTRLLRYAGIQLILSRESKMWYREAILLGKAEHDKQQLIKKGIQLDKAGRKTAREAQVSRVRD